MPTPTEEAQAFIAQMLAADYPDHVGTIDPDNITFACGMSHHQHSAPSADDPPVPGCQGVVALGSQVVPERRCECPCHIPFA